MFLPTVSDFMKVDNDGKIIDTGVSVSISQKNLKLMTMFEKKKCFIRKSPC